MRIHYFAYDPYRLVCSYLFSCLNFIDVVKKGKIQVSHIHDELYSRYTSNRENRDYKSLANINLCTVNDHKNSRVDIYIKLNLHIIPQNAILNSRIFNIEQTLQTAQI